MSKDYFKNSVAAELAAMMNEDLANEYKHMHVYFRAGVMIQGLHREELSEFFLKEAAHELKHCEEFARKIMGLGGVPTTKIANYDEMKDLVNPNHLLEYILRMEEEVVQNFCANLTRCNKNWSGVDPTVIGLFYEDQILDSRSTVDNIKEMLKGL